ncbi:nucleotidyltransferase domain-containing protein [Candidatus Poribacteria bacterium]|nr:nucleotidyltransferase domain-containing protein [Candidatus Poribacteria bacterium]
MATVTEDTLQEIIDRIVNVADPERIILFGSAAKGDMDENSNVDLLVIKGGDYDYYGIMGDIYMRLHGVEQAVDVILVTPEQIEQYKDSHYLIIAPALKKAGKYTMFEKRYAPDDPILV